ncbi:MAG TPA: efflux transporter outer membrane subunit [Casimicrobiaceae bacterium]|nr:efflux transporter outer membrane subunit [Casimicrobiaceae bacterium]
MNALMHARGIVARFRLPAALAIFGVLALAGCTLGPNYARPEVVVPENWRELPPTKIGEPRDDQPRGPWWQLFNDPTLDAMERDAEAANQTLRVAEANYRQARAAVDVARAAELPTLGASANVQRARAGGRGTSNSSGSTGSTSGSITTYQLGLDAAWELDLWGRVRRQVESSSEQARASAADLENTRLSIQTELATDYLQLRIVDAAERVLLDTVQAYQRSLTLTENRYNAGVVARVDVVQAQSQLLSAQASLIDIRASRAQVEHAIAILTGRPPANVTVAVVENMPALPEVPLSMPSELLERRPDVAAAERRMAAANAQIGAATAAMFPTVSLSGSGGYAGTSLARLFSAPALFWSIGSSLAQPLFDAGLRLAQREEAIAAYDASVATYRQTVLMAFRDVEDNLAALRILGEEADVQDRALAAARQSLELTTNQYRAGLVGFLNVVVVQAQALAAERDAINLRGRRYAATVALVKALGGGFEASTLASR